MISTVNGITVSYRIGQNDKDLWFPSMRHFNAQRYGGRERLFRNMREEIRQVVDMASKASSVGNRALLNVRKALPSDLHPIFELANQSSVREASFRRAPINWEEHVRWFPAMITDPLCGFYVAEIAGSMAGQLRFNRDGDQAVVSISVDPRFRGKGVGAALYSQGLADFRLRHPVRKIIAKIKKRNGQSIAFFQRLGFVDSSCERINDEEAVIMVDYPQALEVEP